MPKKSKYININFFKKSDVKPDIKLMGKKVFNINEIYSEDIIMDLFKKHNI